jgi:opacity protein-like surface antigen
LQTQTFSNGSVDTSFHVGPSLEVAAGYDFGDFRADLSYVYGRAAAENASLHLFGATQNLATTGSIQTNSIFLNGYYYVPAKHKVRPYLGGGVGYTRLGCGVGASVFGINYECGSSASTLGYQAKLGVTYQSTTQFELFAEGVYRGLTSRVSTYDSLDSFGVQAGLRYHFQAAPAK